MTQYLVSWMEITLAVVVGISGLALQFLPAPGLQRIPQVRSLRSQSWRMRALHLIGIGVVSSNVFLNGVMDLQNTYWPWMPIGTLLATAIVLLWVLLGGARRER